MKNTYHCACGNCHIQYKTTCDIQTLPNPIEIPNWSNPICSTTSTIILKYKHFNESQPLKNQKYSTFTCKFCQTFLGYYIQTLNESHETTFIFNPELNMIDERRNDMIFSDSFKLWIKNETKLRNDYYKDYLNDLNDFGSQCVINNELIQKKNEIISELYDEKERKVRDFVLEQEELFEEKRCEVKRHQDILKSMLNSNVSIFDRISHSESSKYSKYDQFSECLQFDSEIHKECIENNGHCDENCHCECHQFNIDLREKEMFDFDEDVNVFEDECVGMNSLQKNKELKRLKQLDKRVFGKCENQDENEFPTSFREFSLSRSQNLFDDSF